MTTYNHSDSYYDRRRTEDSRRGPNRQRMFTRAFVLGATVAVLMVGAIWLAVDVVHGDAAAKNQSTPTTAVTPANGANTPATTGGRTTTTPAARYQTGPAVAALQTDLGRLNYYESNTDGVYGPATTAAVENFQRANHLQVDGVAGPGTMTLIQKQLITGDSQMSGSGLPSKHTGSKTDGSTANSSSTNGSSSNTGSSTNGSSTNGSSANTGGSGINS
jgi:peptidoglycan hydrolase-like protein with peptidoglycan-binding domain